MVTSTDEQRMAAWRAFLLTYSTVLRSLEQEMEDEQGIPLSWYEILARLDDAEGGAIRMQELAESVLLSRSGLTRLIDRMEVAGLVERRPCPEDRRGTFAVITTKGKATFKKAVPSHIDGIQQHFLRYLDLFDVQALHRVLGKILDAEVGDECSQWWRANPR